jgi:transcriptional regulator with XRE-family HTH domain
MAVYPPSAFELARRARGLTQSNLADRAGVSRALVAMAERGYRPGAATQQRIAAVLQVDVDHLWPGREVTA